MAPSASSYLCRQTWAFGVYPGPPADGVEQMTVHEIGREKQVERHCSPRGALRPVAGICDSGLPAWVPPCPRPRDGSEEEDADCRFDGL